jgi:diguanylate cyclase (GGDEF)-like protein
VNDTLGHTAGDDLLRQVAERVHESVRLGDYVGRPDAAEPQGEVSRLGGDEFTVLLTKLASGEDAAKVAQRVLEELARPIPVGGYELYTTASIGIAVYPDDGDDLETLLRNADTAMYHAKSRNGNNYQFYTEAMNASATRKLHLASQLRHALEDQQFTLHYQPIRDAETGAISAAEALLRWNEPGTGPVGPEEFIPIAEDSGLILAIGEWVLRNACAQMCVWQNEGFEPIRVAVNVSTHQLRQPGWPKVVARVLEETGLSPAHLELELTESAILEHEDATIRALAELNEMGVGLVLDDFGTGYSSLSSLRRFPIEREKIDRSFVGDITADPDDAAMTTAILAMAQSLDLRVIAEGVETVEQADFLRRRGCHELQGFLFSPAVTPAEFVRFLTRSKPA